MLTAMPGARPIFLRILLCSISVGIFSLSFPGGPFPWLVWIYLVPAGLAIHGAGPKQGMLSGLFFGFLIWLHSVWWISPGLVLWVGISLPKASLLTILYSLYASLPYTVFGFASGLVTAYKRPLGPVENAALLTVFVSWLPNLFPGNPSHSLYTSPIFIQVLDLGGVPLLFFILNLVNFLILAILLKLKKHRPIQKPILTLCVVVALTLGYGSFRIYQVQNQINTQENKITISSIQPNLPVKSSDSQASVEAMVEQSIKAIEAFPEIDLVVWPELPIWFDYLEETEGYQSINSAVQAHKTPFVICIGENGEKNGYYNSAIMIKEPGSPPPIYRKQILVPFGEYLPYEKELPWLRHLFPGTLEYRQGIKNLVFEIKPGVRAIPSLCYEIIFTRHPRPFVEKGGNIILNMTDDAWFGPSQASSIHLALGLFRAVEYRIPLVRATNSGNGCFVRATGEIVPGSRTPEFAPATTTFSLGIPEKHSIYFILGDLFLYVLTLYVLVFIGGAVLNPKKNLRIIRQFKSELG